MNLHEYIQSLPENIQLELAVKLAKMSLPIWDEFASRNLLSYKDSIVGLTHSVNKKLLSETLLEIESCLRLNPSHSTVTDNEKLIELHGEFEEPLVAIQDFDWKLPFEVEKTFYSVYNLLESINGNKQTFQGELTLYLSVNQAIDALESSGSLKSDEIEIILKEFKNKK